MMKVLYFTQFYAPEATAGSFRATEQSRFWAKMGHQVTVFTGYPNYPTGQVFDGYQVKLLDEERMDGVRVLRSKLMARDSRSLMNRLANGMSFFFFGLVNLCVHARRIGNDHDVVLGTSGMVMTALLAWLHAAAHRLPFVLELRDVTYRQMMATGKSGRSWSVRAMKWLELFLCKRAQQVVVVTDGFKELLTGEGIPAEKIEVITNGVDIPETGVKRENQHALVLGYFGTLGISQSIVDTLAYARCIAECVDGFRYLIIGEGAQRERMEQALSTGTYSFVELMRGMPAEALEPYYQQTLLSVAKLKKSDDFRYTLPSKIFQIMGRGIAVLFIGPEGEAAELIRTYHAGLVLCGTIAEDMKSLQIFFNQPDWREQLIQMGANGRAAVQSHFQRSCLSKRYAALLEQVKTNMKS